MAANDWIARGVFKEGANSSRHALRCLIPTTLQQLLGAFSSPRQINGNSIPGSPGIDIGTLPPTATGSSPLPASTLYPPTPHVQWHQCSHHPPITTLPPPCSPGHSTEASQASPVPCPYFPFSSLAGSEYTPSSRYQYLCH